MASYTPEQIRQANNARKQLKRKSKTATGKKSSGRGLSPIRDERQIKRPNSAYFKFGIERRESGDFKGIPLGEAAKLITKEWNELGAGEKKVRMMNGLHEEYNADSRNRNTRISTKRTRSDIYASLSGHMVTHHHLSRRPKLKF